MDKATLQKAFEERAIRRVKVGGFDIDGVLRGKYISLEKFWSSVDKGFGFCDVIFGWDIEDALYDRSSVTGWESGFPDALAKIDLETFRVLPSEPHVAHFLVRPIPTELEIEIQHDPRKSRFIGRLNHSAG